MSPMLLSIVVFVFVVTIVAFVASLLRSDDESKVDNRLAVLTGTKNAVKQKAKQSILSQPLDAMPGIIEAIFQQFGQFRLLFVQADTAITPSRFFAVSGGLAVAGVFLAGFAGIKVYLAPGGCVLGLVPLFWLMFRRGRRMKKFGAQLPDALELISRALRAGHSLAAGFNLVQSEMSAPIGIEFGRVFEEQNLGISLEEALLSLTERVPNLDLKFFATAVTLQRQTGGDLAEILDKIGYLVRERFKIFGQIAALTGEGRLSGIVLLALPPVLFVVVYKMNPEYIALLFTDEMGRKMLAGAIVMQLLGALMIRKIINIKV
jgi:tight adherence protein B